MIPLQSVTIVSSGGTMMQLCDQRGAPYPTTGYGALVWNVGPYLIDALLENPRIIGTIEGMPPIDSPIFTGDPQVPTPPEGDNDSSIPNTGWVQNEIDIAIGEIPPPSWEDITDLPDTFPPTIPVAPGDVDDWPFLPLAGGTLIGQLNSTTALTGASTPAINIQQTWNNAATQFTALRVNVTDTASNASAFLADFIAGASRIYFTKTGSIAATGNIAAGVSQILYWTGRSQMSSPADGQIRLTNAAGTDFSRILLGGTTNAFPAIKRNLTALNFRLADDSADAPITAAAATLTGGLTGTTATFSGNISAKNTVTVFGPGGVNTGIVSHNDAAFSIRSQTAMPLYLGAGGSTYAYVATNGTLGPFADGTQSLGAAANRWGNFYTVNATLTGALTGTTATLSTAIPADDNDTSVPTTAWVRSAITTYAPTPDLAPYELKTNKGLASGYAPLDATVKVPAAYLPSYVDDVLEFANLAAFPPTGSTGIIYVALDTNKVYRWSGTVYVEISPSPASLPPSGPAGGDLSGTYPDPTVIKASGAFNVVGALTGTTATFAGKLTVNAPSGNPFDVNIAGAGALSYDAGTAALKVANISGWGVQLRYVGIGLKASGFYSWSSTESADGTPDTVLRRRSVANITQGGVDSATPIAQTLSTQSVVAGTSDTAGPNWTFQSSRGTGTGAGGSILFQTAPAGTTGTAQNALATMLSVTPTGVTASGALTGTTATFTGAVKAGNVAIPAGGTLGLGAMFSTTANFGIHYGSGLPDKAAARGSWYMRSDATAATGFYVNTDGTAGGWVAGGGGGASISVGTTAPASPTDGALWYYTDAVTGGGQLMIYYNDGSTTQWVPASASASSQTIPPGVINDFAGVAAPPGWLLCQGQSVLVSSYPNLHAAIGYLYGGSGLNFNVPDLGGRVVAGKEATATRLTTAGAGIDGATLGAAGGTQTHTLSQAESAAHDHSISTGGHSHSVNPGYSSMIANAGTQWDFTVVAGTTGASGYTGYLGGFTNTVGNLGGATDVRGGSGAHQNTQPTIIMNKIIKT